MDFLSGMLQLYVRFRLSTLSVMSSHENPYDVVP